MLCIPLYGTLGRGFQEIGGVDIVLMYPVQESSILLFLDGYVWDPQWGRLRITMTR